MTATLTSSDGLSGTATLHVNGSGNAAISNGSIQVATMTWDVSGNATISYADGSTETVSL